MSKISAFLKGRKTILILVLAVSLLAVINLCIPDKDDSGQSAEAVQPESGEYILNLNAGKLQISEYMPKNRATLKDEDGMFPDWIELENVSDESISLEGWHISDREDRPGWALPQMSIAPGEHVLLFASGKDRPETLHTDFSISEGEILCLYEADGGLVCSAAVKAAEPDCSMCIDAEGNYIPCLYPSPGMANMPESYEAWQQSLETLSPLIINEILVAPYYHGSYDSEGCDWVELKNASEEALLLSDFCLSDDRDEPDKYRLPEVELEPGGIVTVYCNKDYDNEGFNAGFSLGSAFEHIYLSRNGELMDFTALKDIPFMCSFGRISGENGWFYLPNPSPEKDNGSGFRRISSAPYAVSGDGISEGAEQVRLELAGEGRIYYTTDGSMPDENDSLYTEPLILEETCVVKAVSIEDGAMPSRVRNISCIINEGHSLPVLSLVSDDVGDFNNMYHQGIKPMEIPGSISLLESDGSGFYMPCGVRMHGETSLVLPKKNMSVRFRGAYGQEKLSYDIYGGGTAEFTNLVLRAGQDFYSTIIRNELCQNLCLNVSDAVVTERSRYCVLYINGRYSGIYALMEKPNEQHYAELAGVSRESVTVIESEAPYYSDLNQDVILFCRENDMSQKENYDEFCRRMDVDSLIDWLIMEGFTANTDLTYGNLRYCRSTENDGKWRLIFYDLDGSFHDTEGNFYNVLTQHINYMRQFSSYVLPLMRNEEFRDRLLTRAGEYLNTGLSNESVIEEIDRLYNELLPEVERDYARYGMTLGKWQWNIDYLKSIFAERDWRQHNIDALSNIFNLDEEQCLHYFG